MILQKKLPMVIGAVVIGIGIGFALGTNFETKQVATIVAPVTISPFENISLVAKSAAVYDLTTEKLLFEKNSHAQLPLASLTKLMTALAATEKVGGNYIVSIPESVLSGGDRTSLVAKEDWKLSDLIDQTLVSSSNVGAVAIASTVGLEDDTHTPVSAFVKSMNDLATTIGLSETYYINPTGLDESGNLAGSYGSALDVTKLLSYIAKNEPTMIRATSLTKLTTESESKEKHFATNTNLSVRSLPFLVGGKTGLTDLAGGNLAVIFDIAPNHPVAAVVLGSSEKSRFDDIEKLVDKTLEINGLVTKK